MSHYLSQIAFQPRRRDDYKLASQLRIAPYLQHQKLWEMFQRPAGSEQPFLFRHFDAHDLPRFLMLSDDRPQAPDDRWLVQSKQFQPALHEGQLFSFNARLNPTRSVRQADAKRGKRQDLVMAALHEMPGRDRALERQRLVNQELPLWLVKRGEGAGFEIVENEGRLLCGVNRYEVLRFGASADSGAHKITLGCADFVGQLRVTDPQTFARTLFNGLGHGRSFGLGLMLIKRAH